MKEEARKIRRFLSKM